MDEGAASALLTAGSSLLAQGVVSFEGVFENGDAVEVVTTSGSLVAKGLSLVGSSDLEGDRSQGIVVIHRDDLVVLDGSSVASN